MDFPQFPIAEKYKSVIDRLHFSEEDHRYTLDEGTPQSQVLVSSTQMISGLELSDTSFFRPHHLQAGTDRHYATQLWDEGTLDGSTLDDNTGPALEAWKSFLDHSGFSIDQIEIRCFSDKLRFAGTIDRVGNLGGKRTLLDIKGSADLPTYSLQLWLYKIAWEEMTGEKIDRLISVHLFKTGKYKVREHHSSRTAEAAALGLPVAYRWKKGEVLWSKEVRVALNDICLFSKDKLEK